jgi:uncharacterized protein (DUF2164 family)
MRKRDKDEIIPLTKEQKENACDKIKEYMAENFELDIGNLQAGIMLDYIAKNIGIYYYNQAVADSLSFITQKAEDLYLLMKDEEGN